MINCTENCGQCCYPVTLKSDLTTEKIKTLSGEDADWINKHFTNISVEKALKLNKYLFGDGQYYLCDVFATTTKLCTQYKNRPRMCKDFPWYNKPIKIDLLSQFNDCSYIKEYL